MLLMVVLTGNVLGQTPSQQEAHDDAVYAKSLCDGVSADMQTAKTAAYGNSAYAALLRALLLIESPGHDTTTGDSHMSCGIGDTADGLDDEAAADTHYGNPTPQEYDAMHRYNAAYTFWSNSFWTSAYLKYIDATPQFGDAKWDYIRAKQHYGRDNK